MDGGDVLGSEVDVILADWAQGDVFLSSDVPFVHLTDLARPLTEAARGLVAERGGEGLAVVAEEVTGVMIFSQTCDLVRRCAERPYVQICPLIAADEPTLEDVGAGRSVRFVTVSALADGELVADLERVMTVEKAVLARLAPNRRPGVYDAGEARALARAIGNKSQRAAFPDAFVLALTKMRDEMVKKHGKASTLGVFLRGVAEIRVRALPRWEAVETVEFLFVLDPGAPASADADRHAESLIARFATSEAYPEAIARVVGFETLSALTYRESDPLDLDRLSRSR